MEKKFSVFDFIIFLLISLINFFYPFLFDFFLFFVADEEESGNFDWDAGLEDSDDSSVYFQPEAGNVIFASALDGWGFTTEHFVEIFSRKLGVSRTVLRKTI